MSPVFQVRVPGPGGESGSGGGGSSSWAFVNAVSESASSIGNTAAMSLSVTAGNFLWIYGQCAGLSGNCSPIAFSDSAGNTYVYDQTPPAQSPNYWTISMAHVALLKTTGTITITMAVTGSNNTPNMVAMQFRGQASSGLAIAAPSFCYSTNGAITSNSFSPAGSTGNLVLFGVSSGSGSTVFSGGTTSSGQACTIPTGASAASNGSIAAEYCILNASGVTTVNMGLSGTPITGGLAGLYNQ